jgi:GT2 family glycosyltransferase
MFTMQPLISLVILGYQNFERVTRPCLESLVPWFNDLEIEVIIVDNGSADGSAEKTKLWCAQHTRLTCHLSKTNLGFAGGMNWGASHAHGKWLFLINNDTIFPVKAIDALKQVLLDAPKNIAMIGPVTNSAGNGQRLWRPDASHTHWLEIGRWLHEHPTRLLMPTYRCDFFCIAIRSDVWVQLSGLDTSFSLGYYEDFDFSLRLRSLGFDQKITEDVFILHLGSASFQATKSARDLMKRNKKRLKAKHPSASFEHTRLGNLSILEKYIEYRKMGQWNEDLSTREQLRIRALIDDAPRSPIKKWIWNNKIRSLIKN